MSPENTSVFDREHAVLFQTYKRLPIAIDRAEGCRIYDREGRAYLDFLGGIAVNTLGHSHPAILDAIRQQAQRYLHVSNYFFQEPQIALAESLLQHTGMRRVFYTNSGTEALEGALKIVRRWGHFRNKSEILSFDGGFHGRTYAALSLMDKPHYKDTMGPFLPQARVIPFNDSSALRDSVSADTSALILEFVQGEGGLRTASEEFIGTLAALREQYGFLLIADEIQTGVGRTGAFCAFQHYSIQPDIVLLAKGLGGGLPLGAILGGENVEGIWERGMHGSTFGGNALACAAGLAVLQEMDRACLLDKVRQTSARLHAGLERLRKDYPSLVEEVRGKGLMTGLKLHVEAAPFVAAMLKKHIIINATSGNVIRLLPPLIAGSAEVEELVSALAACFHEHKG